MSRHDDLTLFSYEVLALVGRGGAGAHDLLRMAKQGRFLAWAGESQYYVEPKRLAKLGYDGELEDSFTRWTGKENLEDRVDGIEAIDVVGPDNVTFETDYPHTDSTWPDTLAVATELMAGVPQDIVDKVMRTNAARMLSLDV